MIRTKDRLGATLDAEGLTELAERARNGDFDDYESESATPPIDLVTLLYAAGRKELARRAEQGEWDGTKEEADAWMQREGKHLFFGGADNV